MDPGAIDAASNAPPRGRRATRLLVGLALALAALAALAIALRGGFGVAPLGPRPVVVIEHAPAGAVAEGGDKLLEFTNFVRVQVPEGGGFSSTKEFSYEGWLIEVPTTRWMLKGPDRSMVMTDGDGVGNGELRFDGHVIEGNQFRVDRDWRVHVLRGAGFAPALEAAREL